MTVALHDGKQAPRHDVIDSTFQAGEIVAGRFEISHLIATGGMGEIYLADDLELGIYVALKTITPGTGADKRRFRLLEEVRLARQVTHPNVCRIFEVFYHEEKVPPDWQDPPPGVMLISMEYLDGETLAERLDKRRRLSTGEALPIVAQIGRGLAASHEVGIIHCDLKASNIMIVEATFGERVVVTDFGLAEVDPEIHGAGRGEACPSARPEIAMGTPAYMAPEQVLSEKITLSTDIYSLGVVMYEMVTGVLPFVGKSSSETALLRVDRKPRPPRMIVPDLDPRWNHTILRCLEPDPSDRFASSLAVVDSLRGPRQSKLERWPSSGW